MGGKARTAFQLVLWGAAIWASGGGATAALGSWAGTVFGGAAVVYGAWAAREARKKAENAALAGSATDRKITIRGGTVAKSYLFGTGWTGGVVAGHREALSKDDPYFWLVVALPIAHEITQFNDVVFGDTSIFPLDANGDSQAPAFSRYFENTHVERGIVPADGLITLTGDPKDAVSDIMYVMGPMLGKAIHVAVQSPFDLIPSGDSGPVYKTEATATLFPPTSRNVVKINNASPGDMYTITYTYAWTRSHIRAWLYRGTIPQAANQPMIDATSGSPPGLRWTSQDQLNGIPYAVFRLLVDPDVFPKGLENFAFQIAGHNKILDIADGVVKYTPNPILCARQYALEQCGVPATMFDLNQLVGERNICDEPIPIDPSMPNVVNEYPGYTDANPHQPRYTCNLFLSTEAKPRDNLALILSTCDGTAVPSGASFDLRCGHYEPPTMALDDSDFVTPPTVTKGMSRPDLFNQVRARFTNWRKPFWPLDDAPAYTSEVYAEQDKQIIMREYDLEGIISPYAAHRMIKQYLHRSRSGMRLTAVFSQKSLRISPEQTVSITCRSLGLYEKVFRVKVFKPQGLGLVQVEFQEDAPQLYQWDYTESAAFDPAPNSSLPSVRSVPAISGLTAITNRDASTFGPHGELTSQCLVKWDRVTDFLVLNAGHIEIRYKRIQDSVWGASPHLEPRMTEWRFPCRRGDVLIIEARLSNGVVRGPWRQFTKVADDAPTQYLTGNLLLNAEFEFDGMRTVDPTPDFPLYKGWIGANNGVAGFVNPAANPMIPFRPFDGVTPTLAEPRHTGIILWQDTQGTSGARDTWIRSNHVGVTPGDRMVGFVWGWVESWSRSFIQIEFWDQQGDFVGWDYDPDYPEYRSPYITNDGTDLIFSPTKLKITSLFQKVPANAYTATLLLRNIRIENVPGFENRYPAVLWYRPYLGRASAGQITLPNWTKT